MGSVQSTDHKRPEVCWSVRQTEPIV